jgi:hypothetical protein
VSTSSVLLDRAGIERAFSALGARLARRGVVADVYVIDGAAIALAYNARRATRDIDAAFRPPDIVVEEATAVARELGLPCWWRNDQASVYAAADRDPDAPRVFDHPGLRVSAASGRHLRAMKVLAARRRDADDIATLVRHLDVTSIDAVLAVCRDVIPDEPVPDRARLILEDLLEGSESTEP